MPDDERTRRRLGDATKSRIADLASGWDTPEPELTPEPEPEPSPAIARPRTKTLPPPPPGSQARKQLEEAILDAVVTPAPVLSKPDPLNRGLEDLFGPEDSAEAPAKPSLPPPRPPALLDLDLEDRGSASTPHSAPPRSAPPTGPNLDALFGAEDTASAPKPPLPRSAPPPRTAPASPAGPNLDAMFGAEDSIEAPKLAAPTRTPAPAPAATPRPARLEREDGGPNAGLDRTERAAPSVRFDPEDSGVFLDPSARLPVPASRDSDDEVVAREAPAKPKSIKDRLTGLNPLAKSGPTKLPSDDFAGEAPSRSLKDRLAALNPLAKKAPSSDDSTKEQTPRPDPVAKSKEQTPRPDPIVLKARSGPADDKSKPTPGDDFATESPSKSFNERMAELDAVASKSGPARLGAEAQQSRPAPTDDFGSEAPSKSFKERMAELDVLSRSGPTRSAAPEAQKSRPPPSDDFASESPSRSYRQRMAELDLLARSGATKIPSPESSEAGANATRESDEFVYESPLPPPAAKSNPPGELPRAVPKSNPPSLPPPRSNPPSVPPRSNPALAVPRSNPPSVPVPRSNPPSAPVPAKSGPIGIGAARTKPTTAPPPRGKPSSAPPPPPPPRARAASVPPPIPDKRSNAPYGAMAGPTETGTVELHGAIGATGAIGKLDRRAGSDFVVETRTPARDDETDYTGPPASVVPVPLGEFELGGGTDIEKQKLRIAYEQSTHKRDPATALLGMPELPETKVKPQPIEVLLGETAHRLRRDPGSLPETIPFERGDPTSLGGDPTLAYVDPTTATQGSLRAGAALRRKRGLGGDVQYVLTVLFGVRKARSELSALDARQLLRQDARKRSLITLGRIAATIEGLDHPALGRAREGLMAAEDERSQQTAAVAAADSELSRVRRDREVTAKQNAGDLVAIDKELAELANKLEPLEKEVAGIAKRAADLKDQLRKLDNKIASTEQNQQTAKPEAKLALAADLATLKADRTAVQRDEPKLAAELDTLSPAIAELEAKRAEAKQRRTDIEADEAKDRRRADDLLAAISTKRKVVDRAASDAEVLRDKILFELGERLYVDRPKDLTAELSPIDSIDVEIGTGDRRVMELKEILASVDKAKLARGIGVLALVAAVVIGVTLLATGTI